MNPANHAEDDSIRRFARFEWLCHQIQQAAREADALMRLEHELRRMGDPGPARTPVQPVRPA